MNKADKYFHENEHWAKEIKMLRGVILDTELIEVIKWGMPVYTFEKKNIVGIGSFKSYFGIWFYHGALLEDSHNILVNAQEGKTRAMRQWRMSSMEAIDEIMIKEYIGEAIENEKKGLKVKPVKTDHVEIPRELRIMLEKDKSLFNDFNKFSTYKQKEFCEYIAQASRQATIKKRIERIIPMIQKGEGLNDRYRKSNKG